MWQSPFATSRKVPKFCRVWSRILGINTTVQCVTGVLQVAVKRIREELLPRYPNVDDAVVINHQYGCGVAIDAPEAYIPKKIIRNIARHQNFGGVFMLVSLGCEKFQPEMFCEPYPEHRTDSPPHRSSSSVPEPR